LIDESIKTYPLDFPTTAMAVPLIRAAIERSRGNSQHALELLEAIRPYDLSFLCGAANNYLRGKLYLDLKNGGDAAREFQAIIQRRGVDSFSPTRPLSYLGLARAYAMSGDTSASRKAYQDFFALWKDADPDLELLAQARKEYDTLK
jgi:predicted Zn-dependent protease